MVPCVLPGRKDSRTHTAREHHIGRAAATALTNHREGEDKRKLGAKRESTVSAGTSFPGPVLPGDYCEKEHSRPARRIHAVHTPIQRQAGQARK